MSELTDDRLLPCPFCGGKAYAHAKPLMGYPRVMCEGEDCLGRQSGSTIEEAIAAWNRRAAASTSTEGAGVIEEAQTIAQRMRQIVQDVWDKREGYTDDQAWTDLHGQAMRLLEWDVRSRALNPPAPKVTTQERNA